MKKIMKRVSLGLVTIGMLMGSLSVTPSMAQASSNTTVETHKITETTGDGEHYFTVDGKYYTPEEYAAWEAAQTASNNTYVYNVKKLTAKKSKSGKSVKVTGKVVATAADSGNLHKATYVRIKTYKGYKYAKLTKSMTFSKTIAAPKAKTVMVRPGYYKSTKKNGKTVKVFQVWGANKKVTVKAYK
ncbi:hypothetical protein [Lactiplantibacillus daowaiensis]|uniref:Uncharacterized protein n=1 Tax=Lactiplantibacillus daowaiensis TaxID=2559918 RepID=A0ABW1RWW7_9LACO|nr:hypothetical protein [Lactiplantibacillus daowaiensis]